VGGTFSGPVDVGIEFCSDTPFDPSSRRIEFNLDDVTDEFTYEDPPGPECAYTKMSYGTVNVTGSSLLTARICNSFGCMSKKTNYSYPTGQPPIVDLSDNPGSLYSPASCLTSDAGPAGTYACGSLILSHSLPAFRSRDGDHAPTLVYNSTSADRPTPVLVRVKLAAGAVVPDSMRAVVTVNGVERGRWTYSTTGLTPGGRMRRLALQLDTLPLPTGAYPYAVSLESFSASYSGGMSSTQAGGTRVFVNLRNSPYGTGWSVAGTDQLFTTNVPANTKLLVEADGGYALYTLVAGTTNRWVAPVGVYRDTLVQGERTMPAGTSGGYWRRLLNGLTLFYNTTGRHIWTMDPSGDTVEYAYRNPASQRAGIMDIRVAPRTSNLLFHFTYTTGGTEAEMLSAITDPAGRVTGARTNTAKRLAMLIDPAASQNPSYSPAFPGPAPTQSATDTVRFSHTIRAASSLRGRPAGTRRPHMPTSRPRAFWPRSPCRSGFPGPTHRRKRAA
jgi:hypothetical protein